ncbi:MAG: metal ABC transporter permease [Verrucomicrobiota bacterium]|nr:metal ABC transporter permease [Limisphaera sp.]MDW8380582.1 metal ABC transporter permease [Verrucomicrobiota bacterium]
MDGLPPEWHETIRLLGPPLTAALVLPGLLVYYGLHILERGIIFIDLALAQVATIGTCVCILLGHEATDIHAYAWSVGFTIVGALLFTVLREPRHGRVRLEALIGIVYVVAAAVSILLLSRAPHGREELQKTLVGDLLTVSWPAVTQTMALYALLGLIHWIWRRQFLRLTFDREGRWTGVDRQIWDFGFYVMFGLVVTTFVHLGGVLLVFSYLIIPAVCGRLWSASVTGALGIGWVVALTGGLGGLVMSYQLDVPGGAAVICVLGGLLVLCAGAACWPRPQLQRRREDRLTQGSSAR